MKVLVTGAAGFLGRNVVTALLENNVEVTGIVRTKQNLIADVDLITTEDLFAEPLEFLINACECIDAVVHCAWSVKNQNYLESTENLNCLSGTVKFARAAQLAGVKHFQGIGTCMEYELDQAKCGSPNPLTIQTPLAPTNLYGSAKASAFVVLSELLDKTKFAWSRVFYLYGSGEHENRLVPYVHQNLSKLQPVYINNGSCIVDYLDVSIAGKKVCEVTLNGLVGPINICSGIPISISDFVFSIAKTYKRDDLIKVNSDIAASSNSYIVGQPSL